MNRRIAAGIAALLVAGTVAVANLTGPRTSTPHQPPNPPPQAQKHGLGVRGVDANGKLEVGEVARLSKAGSVEDLYKQHGHKKPPPVSALPPTFSIGSYSPLPPVLDQHLNPTCVSFTSAGADMWLLHKRTGSFPSLNVPQFAVDIHTTSAGAYMSTAVSYMKNSGYPNNDSAHKIANYATVAGTVTAIKDALTSAGPGGTPTPVVLITPWYQSWFTLSGSGDLPPPTSVVGGHAIWFTGWDDARHAFKFRNSWGTDWGLSGNGYFPYAYLGRVYHFYAVVNPTPSAPKPTPAPTPKATPRPTPTATPRPTPKATLAPTPRPTVRPSVAPSAAPHVSASPRGTIAPTAPHAGSSAPATFVSLPSFFAPSLLPSALPNPTAVIQSSPESSTLLLVIAALIVIVLVGLYLWRHR